MANYNTSANVVLSVNGRQAEKVLNSLQQEASNLTSKLNKAALAGDKVTMKKLQRELTSTNRLINQMQGSAKTAEQVLNRLDKATPRELQKTLRTLQQQLNGIERGSGAWNKHVEKIKRVKEELSRVNSTLSTQQSKWDKMNVWLNNTQTFLVGAAAALTGLVMAGKKAVNTFADMEQEMANVRKYTGMSAQEVESLNEEFKKLDTRTTREDLNRLAQEAGRLGKTSQEDVIGFVRAADKINVALDDLGEGATLTLSKLTGIFGDEERLGTEQALLSVGSVINELSQNCSASAPYIAEFASRMGGVGSQARMTVQEIMGFAAVLDSNNQNLEASSTALSQVIVRIYQDPAKYARAAGIDVAKFSKMVKDDMNGALIYFLETLNKAGNMDVLSPMFKDMGENGSRAISALSTLANNIDQVKAQQEVANEAFTQAISIDKEYNVQNNTVKASLEKARNKVTELAVELGEKLHPVMKFVVSSSTMMMKALNVMVDFFIKYKTEIVTLTVAVAAYNAILLIYNARTALATKTTALFHSVTAVMKGVLPALRILFVPLINTVQYFTNGLQVNLAMQTRWRKAMAAMSLSNWVGLIVAAAAAVYLLATRFKNAASEAEKAYTEIEKDAKESTAVQIKMLDELYNRTQNNKLAIDERKKAIDRLRKIYPDYFKELSDEAILTGKAKDKYLELRDAILEAARVKGREKKIADLESEIVDLQSAYETEAKPWIEKKFKAMQKNMMNPERLENDPDYIAANWTLNVIEKKFKPQIEEKKAVQKKLAGKNVSYQLENDSNKEIGEGLSDTDDDPKTTIPTVEKSDKFQKEKDDKLTAETNNRIAYVTGKKDYLNYLNDMNRINVEYNKKILEREDLTDQERLQYQADYYEAVKKQDEQFRATDEQNVENWYNELTALNRQFYIDGKISKETYNSQNEQLELLRLKKLLSLQEQGSKEQLDLQKQLDDKLIKSMEERRKKTEDEQNKINSFRQQFFSNGSDNEAKYNADLSYLQLAFEKELQAAGDNAQKRLQIEEQFQQAKLTLQQKYGLATTEDNRNAIEKGIGKAVEWLNSDGGKAMTGALDTITSGMSSIFSGMSSMIQAELEQETAAIEKRYDSEISAAEGNTYKVKKLEKEKNREIAKAKNEANKKMFAMQVIQAVAQTAQNAINAFGSAAAVPLIGYLLAPAAAGMAIAAGMIQIASIKKQQQAAQTQGYSVGGFTPDGGVNEPVGVVHAGEWVASQKLVKSPKTRPIIDTLEKIQRNNTIGVINANDVSRSITAPVILANQSQKIPTTEKTTTVVINQNEEYVKTMQKLTERLEKPFVTVATVTGDYGINRAQEQYSKLIKNKSPKK